MAKKVDLFEDIATAMESWTAAASDALTNEDSDLTWVESSEPYQQIRQALVAGGVSSETVAKVLSECLRGFGASVFVALDGGTRLAETGRLYLVDDNGNRLGEGLHDDFVGYLLETGRLT